MSSKRTEDLAVNRLIEAIYKNDNLEPYIDTNDKTPSWDGNIFVYKSKSHSKDNLLGKIPIQVKGTEYKGYDGEHIKFPVQVSDLKNYLNDGGVLYFVIRVDSMKNSKIYYANLLPVDIKKYLEDINLMQNKISIDMEKLDTLTSSKLSSVCTNFLVNRKYQSSTYSYAKKMEDFKHFLIPISSTAYDLEDYIMNNPVYMYGKADRNDIPIPVEKIRVDTISTKVYENISIGSEVYYDHYEYVFKKQEKQILIGKGVRCTKNNENINFNFTGSLSERIKDTNFICAIIDSKTFNIGEDVAKDISFPMEVMDIVHTQYKYLTETKNLLDYFKVETDLQMDKMTEEDFLNLDLLINVVLYNRKVRLKSIKEGPINIEISNLTLIVTVSFDNEGYVKIDNLFNEELKGTKCYLSIGNDINNYDCSIYVMLKSKGIINASNLNLAIIEKSIKSIEYSEPYSHKVNALVLELIAAYDSKNELKDCLDTALSLTLWLVEHQPLYLGNKLNELQIYKRLRKLTAEEVSLLIEAKRVEQDYMILCGISILLDNFNEFEYYFKSLSPHDQDEVITYPIYNLIKDKLDNINN
jgi:hypothetical protein